MHINNKYYIPTIDEFRIGFEYELCFNNEWRQFIFDELRWFNHPNEESSLSYPALIKQGNIRVKYLDKEDIESLGFKLSYESEYEEYIYNEYEYKVNEDLTWELDHFYNDQKDNVELRLYSHEAAINGEYSGNEYIKFMNFTI